MGSISVIDRDANFYREPGRDGIDQIPNRDGTGRDGIGQIPIGTGISQIPNRDGTGLPGFIGIFIQKFLILVTNYIN